MNHCWHLLISLVTVHSGSNWVSNDRDSYDDFMQKIKMAERISSEWELAARKVQMSSPLHRRAEKVEPDFGLLAPVGARKVRRNRGEQNLLHPSGAMTERGLDEDEGGGHRRIPLPPLPKVSVKVESRNWFDVEEGNGGGGGGGGGVEALMKTVSKGLQMPQHEWLYETEAKYGPPQKMEERSVFQRKRHVKLLFDANVATAALHLSNNVTQQALKNAEAVRRGIVFFVRKEI